MSKYLPCAGWSSQTGIIREQMFHDRHLSCMGGISTRPGGRGLRKLFGSCYVCPIGRVSFHTGFVEYSICLCVSAYVCILFSFFVGGGGQAVWVSEHTRTQTQIHTQTQKRNTHTHIKSHAHTTTFTNYTKPHQIYFQPSSWILKYPIYITDYQFIDSAPKSPSHKLKKHDQNRLKNPANRHSKDFQEAYRRPNAMKDYNNTPFSSVQ